MLTSEILEAYGPLGAIAVVGGAIWWRAYVGKVDAPPVAGLTADDKLWLLSEVRDHICQQIDRPNR
jgi:hypothetical protein